MCYNQPSMVHEDKQLDEVEKVDTIVVQNQIVLILNIDFFISKEFHDVMECKALLFNVLPDVVPILWQALRARVLILLFFKTQGRVFFKHKSMIEGALKPSKILFPNEKIILFSTLNFECSFKGFV